MVNVAERDGGSPLPVPSHDAVVPAAATRRLATGPGRVAVVAAPAGYGKTTAVATWASKTALPVAWIDLEAMHNDPTVLLAAVVDALATVTDLDVTSVASLRSAGPRTTTMVAPQLGRAVGRCTVPFGLVLDDAHTVEAPTAIDLLDALVAHVPAGARVVLSGRTVRLPSLARLRAGVGLTELGQSDLEIGPAEARQVLSRMGVPIDDGQLMQVIGQTEGWAVGVRLAGLALLDGDASAGVSRSDHQVTEYFRSEWLRGLDDHDVRFLSRVSVLDVLDGPLCDHVLQQQGSGHVLERIHANRLLVIPLDRRHETFRMHRLLREVLHAELDRTDPGEGLLVHLRASEWFERAGDIDRAVHHAIEGSDLDRAERLVSDFASTMHTRGMCATVARWLELFPPERVRQSAGLCLSAALAALGVDGAATKAWADLGERTIQHRTDDLPGDEMLPRWRAFRALLTTGPVAPAIDDAEAALGALPPGVWHAVAGEVYGAHLLVRGDLELATSTLESSEAEARIFGAATVEVISAALRSVVARVEGDTERACRIAREARRRQNEYGLDHWPTAVVVTAVSALAEAMSGEPGRANDEMLLTRQHMAYIEGIGAWANVIARLTLAETCLLLGDRVGAKVLLKEAALLLAAQPDAACAHRRHDELSQLVSTTASLPVQGPSSLSTAELRVLHYLPTNLTLGEIGERLYVSRHTTKSHVASIYRKLGTTSRQETVEVGRAVGLLPTGSTPIV